MGSPQIRDPGIALHDVLDQQEREMIESALAKLVAEFLVQKGPR